MESDKFLLLNMPCCKQKRVIWSLKSQCWETSTDNAHCFTLYLNYTSRKVMLINSLMYEGNIQISEYEGTYLTLI